MPLFSARFAATLRAHRLIHVFSSTPPVLLSVSLLRLLGLSLRSRSPHSHPSVRSSLPRLLFPFPPLFRNPPRSASVSPPTPLQPPGPSTPLLRPSGSLSAEVPSSAVRLLFPVLCPSLSLSLPLPLPLPPSAAPRSRIYRAWPIHPWLCSPLTSPRSSRCLCVLSPPLFFLSPPPVRSQPPRCPSSAIAVGWCSACGVQKLNG